MAKVSQVVRVIAAAVTVSLVAVGVAVPASASPTHVTQLVSATNAGVPGNQASSEPSSSADGRYVAFSSNATNLVPGDTNNVADIFVRDLFTDKIMRVSVGVGGHQANRRSNQPRISGDGRYVAFASGATNLVPGDINHEPDVFVRDLQTGVTRLVSVGVGGAPANGDNASPAISADGRYVAFVSDSSNLVTGDTNGNSDVFVRDMTAGTTTLVSVSTSGSQTDAFSDEPSISADGRFIAFESGATNLVSGDTNGVIDVFLRDRTAGTTIRISVGSGGVQADGEVTQPAISADGRYIAYVSEATNLVASDTDANGDVVRHSLINGANRQISFRTDNLPGSFATSPSISADGNLVTFTTASDLVPADTNGSQDVYLRNVHLATNELVSVDLSGVAAGADTANGVVSANGHRVAFTSSASTLVVGDTNNTEDVFARSR